VIDFLLEVFERHALDEAIVWHDRAFTYAWLLEHIETCRQRLDVEEGTVVAVEADFSPAGVALFLTLIERGAIIVPLTSAVAGMKAELTATAEIEVAIELDAADGARVTPTGRRASHTLYERLRKEGHPGLVLFSSGSTGQTKAAVHDLAALLEKFKTARRAMRTISFLLYDHIGGINTMLHTLANGGCMITVADRAVDSVLAAVERHRAGLLPTSPTFMNLILLSGAAERFTLSTLTTVTYGTEPMPEATLRRFHETFPHIALQQTYGLSEVGILRSKSKSSDSLWVKIGGEGFETRVVDGTLHIRARSAMLGYLNAPSPFTEDGWLNTGDAVEVEGEYLRILGRKSELINVGGEKVYPAEVESVLLEMPNVRDVVVTGQPNPIVGQIVLAHVTVSDDETNLQFTRRMREFCKDRLAPYKIPAKVELVDHDLFNSRFKRLRSGLGNES
jgi:long-chain acyl-CoA synthetase